MGINANYLHLKEGGLRGLNMNEEYIIYGPKVDECYITDIKPF